MKRLTILMGMLLLQGLLHAQTMEIQRHALGGAGPSLNVQAASVGLEIVQSIRQQSPIGYYSKAALAVRQGYLQPPLRSRPSNETTTPLQVYPNPFVGQVTFEWQGGIGARASGMLKVYSTSARKVFERQLQSGGTVDLGSLSAGLWFYRIETKDGQTFGGKLLRE